MKKILLTQGKSAIIDDADFEEVSKYKWCVDGRGYVVRGQWEHDWTRIIKLHRFLLSAKRGQIVDHANGNKLDNRRENLRFCTHSQNGANSKKKGKNRYRGTTFNKAEKKWRAQIKCNYRVIGLGSFADELSAAKAYDIKARELFGEFARTNF